jgi:hypothetical protein
LNRYETNHQPDMSPERRRIYLTAQTSLVESSVVRHARGESTPAEHAPTSPQFEERRARAVVEVVDAIKHARSRGACRTAVSAYAVERYGHEVVLPAYESVRQELAGYGFHAVIDEDMSDDRWMQDSGKRNGSLTLTIDWSRPVRSE